MGAALALTIAVVVFAVVIIRAYDWNERRKYIASLSPQQREELRGFALTNRDWRLFAQLNKK